MSLDIFKDIVHSILVTKRNVLLTEEDEKSYLPFIVNRALSFHHDCVMQANEMNKTPLADKKLQYDFLLNIIRGYKRPFRQWDKYIKPVDLDIVKEYYGYSNEKAMEALRLLSSDQIQIIKRRLDRGGVDNARKYDRNNTKKQK